MRRITVWLFAIALALTFVSELLQLAAVVTHFFATGTLVFGVLFLFAMVLDMGENKGP